MEDFLARRRYGFLIPGLAVLLVGLALTYWLLQRQINSDRIVTKARFTEEIRVSTEAIEQKIVTYTEIVSGFRDLFLIDPALGRLQFERIAANRDVRVSYPEIRNISFVRWVPKAALSAYETNLQAFADLENMPLVTVHPQAQRDNYYIVDYIWPADGNKNVLGLDISSQPENLESILVSRVEGRPTVSAPFVLDQDKPKDNNVSIESISKAFVIRVPVYAPGAGPNSPDPYFLGAVGTVIDVDNMLNVIAGHGSLNRSALKIVDMGHGRSDVEPEGNVIARFSYDDQLAATNPYKNSLKILVHGRDWQLNFYPTTSMLSDAEKLLPWWIGTGGIALSLLLACFVSLVTRQRTLALHRAATSYAQMQHTEERFKVIFNQAAVGVALSEMDSGRFIKVNKKYCDLLGYSEEELLESNFQSITYPDDIEKDIQEMRKLRLAEIKDYRLEKRMLHKNGSPVWVSITVSSIPEVGCGPEFYIVVLQDITEQRHLRETLESSEQLLLKILNHLPVGVILAEHSHNIRFINQRFIDIFGFTKADMLNIAQWWQRACPDTDNRNQNQLRWLKSKERAEFGDKIIEPKEYNVIDSTAQDHVIEIGGALLEEGYLMTFEDLSQHKAAEQQINYLAFYDSLTQLPNRRLLRESIQKLLANTKNNIWGAVLLLDIDHFKVLNETRGHEVGDILLRQVAERLRENVGEKSIIGRYGDDEFVVLFDQVAINVDVAHDKTVSFAESIMDALRKPYLLEDMPYHTAVSMGIVMFNGSTLEVDELLKRADIAMYQAKAAGRNAFKFYNPDAQNEVSARALLELDMRQAIDSDEFQLYYQPQVEQYHESALDGDQIVGAEALLRWYHPVQGFISPAVFIPIAEDTGLILNIGNWVLHTACKQLAIWAKTPDFANLTLSVNVSPRQFHQTDFVNTVLNAINETGANPSKLKLELTEGLLLQDVEDAIAKMTRLRSHGLGFSLDDFGTGYSSLAYLKRLPIQELKIDQSFVRDVLVDPNDATIAKTIVALGTSLGLRVIAEGVESDAQREFLTQNNCSAWQGYLLSKPLPSDEFNALVSSFAVKF